MTDHLPECRARYVADLCTTDIDPVLQEPSCDHCVGLGCICICDQLRACEQRVEQQTVNAVTPFLITLTDELIRINYKSGYTTALLAAREAVAALQMGVLTTGTLLLKREDALAAIDALKETNVNTQ